MRSSTVILAGLVASTAGAQTPTAPDTVRHSLPSVIVTADRIPSDLGTSTAPVTRVTAQELNQEPVQRLTDGLRSVPGIMVLDAGAMGELPRVVIRGFYGGGETDYASVLIDGVPVTTLATGLA